jgi:hypothetical protein
LAQLAANLWLGHIPLRRAFWEFAIGYGTVFNLVMTIAAFAAFASDLPDWTGLALFFLPAPYNFLMIVAVWRSSSRYAGPAIWATLARALIVVWAAAATFI